MGWFTDMIGQDNIDAAKAAYNDSRLKGTVDDASQGLGSVNDYIMQKAKEVEAYRDANLEKRDNGAAWWQGGEEGPMTYREHIASKDAPLQDASLDMILASGGANKGLGKIANKYDEAFADTRVLKVPTGNIHAGMRDRMHAGYDDVARQEYIKLMNDASRKSSGDAWVNAMSGEGLGTGIAEGVYKKGLNTRMAPNHPGKY